MSFNKGDIVKYNGELCIIDNSWFKPIKAYKGASVEYFIINLEGKVFTVTERQIVLATDEEIELWKILNL